MSELFCFVLKYEKKWSGEAFHREECLESVILESLLISVQKVCSAIPNPI